MLRARVAFRRTHQRLLARQVAIQRRKLRLQTTRQDEQPHHLNQPDVLLLDVMQRRMRMEDAQRVLFARTVVAQNEIQAVLLPLFAQNRRNGVMGRSVRFRENTARFVAVPAPRVQNPAGFGNQRLFVRAAELNGGHRPIEQCRRNARHRRLQLAANFRIVHREMIASALKMVVIED